MQNSLHLCIERQRYHPHLATCFTHAKPPNPLKSVCQEQHRCRKDCFALATQCRRSEIFSMFRLVSPAILRQLLVFHLCLACIAAPDATQRVITRRTTRCCAGVHTRSFGSNSPLLTILRQKPVPGRLHYRLESGIRERREALVCIYARAADGFARLLRGMPEYSDVARKCLLSNSRLLVVSYELQNADAAELLESSHLE